MENQGEMDEGDAAAQTWQLPSSWAEAKEAMSVLANIKGRLEVMEALKPISKWFVEKAYGVSLPEPGPRVCDVDLIRLKGSGSPGGKDWAFSGIIEPNFEIVSAVALCDIYNSKAALDAAAKEWYKDVAFAFERLESVASLMFDKLESILLDLFPLAKTKIQLFVVPELEICIYGGGIGMPRMRRYHIRNMPTAMNVIVDALERNKEFLYHGKLDKVRKIRDVAISICKAVEFMKEYPLDRRVIVCERRMLMSDCETIYGKSIVMSAKYEDGYNGGYRKIMCVKPMDSSQALAPEHSRGVRFMATSSINDEDYNNDLSVLSYAAGGIMKQLALDTASFFSSALGKLEKISDCILDIES